MARVKPNGLLSSISGKLPESGKISLRSKFGNTHTYKYTAEYTGPKSDAQAATNTNFKQACALYNDIKFNHPDQLADWQARFNEYCEKTPQGSRRWNTLRGFVMAHLMMS